MKPLHEMPDVSMIKIFITFILLIVTIFAYSAVNKYYGADPTTTESVIVEKTGDEALSDKDAEKLAKQKYYIAVATMTNTKTDINKIYNLLSTTEVVLSDTALIENLNKFGAKTFAVNSPATIINNYEVAITNNFTDEFINNNILVPNGIIGKVNDDYYLVREKVDNYFFKEVELTLTSKTNTELVYKAIPVKYESSCASAGSTMPSITCTSTTKGSEANFKLVKDGANWKISEVTVLE